MSILTKAAIIAIAAMLCLLLAHIGFSLLPSQTETHLMQVVQFLAVIAGVILEIWAVVRLGRAPKPDRVS